MDGYEVDHETLWRWLLQARLWRKRRKRALHRSCGSGGRTSASWCNWMARIMNGSRSLPAAVA